MRYLAAMILLVSMIGVKIALSEEPQPVDSSRLGDDQEMQDSTDFMAWRAAMSAALGNDGNLSNISPDITLGWVITVNDSLELWPRPRKLIDLWNNAGNYTVSTISLPVRWASRLLMGRSYDIDPRIRWRIQAGPTVSAQRRSDTVTQYFQALMQPAPAGLSVSSFWTRANYRERDYDSLRYLPVKVVGAVGWGMKFFAPYVGVYRDFSPANADPRHPDSLLSPRMSTDSMALDGLVQHYFRFGMGVLVGRHLALSGNYTLAYHDVVRSSHDSFVKLFGHKPEANGFQYLTLNLQTLIRGGGNVSRQHKQGGGSGSTYFDITWWQQLERHRFSWLKDRQVFTISLRQDFRELPLAFTN